jgi:hypothetical protein
VWGGRICHNVTRVLTRLKVKALPALLPRFTG